jgi:hypothetical protein
MIGFFVLDDKTKIIFGSGNNRRNKYLKNCDKQKSFTQFAVYGKNC